MVKKIFVKKFLPICICALFVPEIHAFNDISHKHVTKTSFEAFTKSEPASKNRDHKEFKYVSDFFKNDETDYKELFVDYSIQPDIDENQGVYKYHFYNPVTKSNFMNEEESALTKFKEHFNKAVSSYKKGEKVKSYQELGRAVHFMEDMNTPVHTAYEIPLDSVKKLPLHMNFEKICDSICGECGFDVIPDTLCYYQINSLDTIANAAATLSADNFYYLENQKMDKKVIAKNSIKNAQEKVSGVLYKFFKEVSEA